MILHKQGNTPSSLSTNLGQAALLHLLRWALTHNPVRNVPVDAAKINRDHALAMAAWTTGESLKPPKVAPTLQRQKLELDNLSIIRYTNSKATDPSPKGETLISYVDYGMNPDDEGFVRRITELYNLLEANNRQVAQILVVPAPGYGGWQYMNLPQSVKAATGNRTALSELILGQLLSKKIIDYSTDLTFFGYSQGGAFAFSLAQTMYALDQQNKHTAITGDRRCICLESPGLTKHNPIHQLIWLAVVEAKQLEAYVGPGAENTFIGLVLNQIEQSGLAQTLAGLVLAGAGLGFGGPRFERTDEIEQLRKFAEAYNLIIGRAPNSSIFTDHAYRQAIEVMGPEYFHTLIDPTGIKHSHAVARNPYAVAAWIAACIVNNKRSFATQTTGDIASRPVDNMLNWLTNRLLRRDQAAISR